MDIMFWIWVILAAILLVGELFTASFFLLPFGLGAAVAAVVNVFGGSLAIQWCVFIIVSVLTLVILRPLAKKITVKEPAKAGVDRLVGMQGTIIEGGSGGSVRARVDRDVWNTSTEDGSVPPIDTKIEVISVEGTHLIVRVVE